MKKSKIVFLGKVTRITLVVVLVGLITTTIFATSSNPGNPYFEISGNSNGKVYINPDVVGIGSNHNGYELNLFGGLPQYGNGGQIRLGGNTRGDSCINAIQFIQNGSEVMRINNGGNVGIGTSNPQYKLTVNGTVKAREVIVTNAGWSDYVFNRNYNLMPLPEIEKYIRKNGHLPGIPTENEVKKQGVSVGEMQAKLLAKIEELTLYTIAQNKKMNAQFSEQNQKIAALEAENTALKFQITKLSQSQ